MEKLLVRPAEAAEIISVSRAKMYELLAQGLIPSIRLGGPGTAIRVPMSALRDWADGKLAAAKESAAA